MDAQKFEELKSAVAHDLTAQQCLTLEEVLRAAVSARLGETAIARREEDSCAERVCPRCGGTKVYRHGYDKRGRQRFRCVKTDAGGCGRSFNALTGTPLARMRKPELWHDYARLMARKHSLNDIKDSGIPISRTTAWHWRHRFLKIPEVLQAARLDGIVEADETFFLEAFKGHRGWTNGAPPANRQPRYRGQAAMLSGLSAEHIPVLTALDRNGGRVEGVLANRSGAEIARVLDGKIAEGAIFCTDGLKPYGPVAKRAKAEHRRFRPPKTDWLKKVLRPRPRRQGALGLGRVNAHHAQLKAFVDIHFRGVSTKYLAAYVGWLRFIGGSDFNSDAFIKVASSPKKN